MIRTQRKNIKTKRYKIIKTKKANKIAAKESEDFGSKTKKHSIEKYTDGKYSSQKKTSKNGLKKS